ncbi:hypothetical protein [Propioniciclava soli]|uniref:Transposase n=1 Tax=Propioniciclava soli TaxID=2775081 RepID=A0ABZ3CCE4_9ACTN|nr:hypothetical protein [Propioniciclava soli]
MRSIRPLLEAMAADETHFAGVTSLGVDEHIWHYVSTKPETEGGRGRKELTGMVDLTVTPTDVSGPGCWTWCRDGRGRPTPTG